MLFLQSILGLLFGRLTVRTAIICVTSKNVAGRFFNGIEIHCEDEDFNLVRNALEEAVQFYGCEWERYQAVLKRVVINSSVNTNVIVSQRATIIKRSETSRMSSVTHLAGWLIADMERLMIYEKNKCRLVVWKSSVPREAYAGALEMRKRYLSERG